MTHKIKSYAAVSIFLIIGLIFAGCSSSETKQEKSGYNSVTVQCPVTDTDLDKARAAEESVHEGKTYYFCCKGCKEAFDKDPEMYTGDD